MASSSIDVSLRLRNAKRFQQDASKSGKSVGDIGKGAKRADRDLGKLEKRSKRLNKGFGGLGKGAKLAMGAIGGAAAFGAAKNAIGATQDLTKRTLGLQRATHMDTKSATAWAAQTKVRGLEAKSVNQVMGTLAKNMTLAEEGGKSQTTAFKRLGISQKELAATGGDVNKVLPVIAEHYKAMGGNANDAKKRTASMMALTGRGWQMLTPLFTEGAKGLREHLGLAEKYGVTLGGKPIKNQTEMLKLQREMQMAQLGWQVQFSTEIAPRLIKAFRFILKTSQSLKGVFSFADKHPNLVKAVAGLALLSATMKRVPGGTWLGRHILSGTGSIASKLAKRLGGPVKAALSRVLGRGGTSAGARGAEALVNSTGSQFATRSKKLDKTIGGRMRRVGTKAGTAGGKAAGVAFVAGTVIGLAGLHVAVTKALKKVNTSVDDWAKRKFGKAGSVYSDIKGFIGDNYPHGLPGSDIVRGGLGSGPPKKAKAVGGNVKRRRQHGGGMRAGQSAIVGEVAPEILTARPSGGFVSRLAAPPVPKQLATAGPASAMDEFHSHTTLVMPSGRVLAEESERYVRRKRGRS